MLKKNKTNAGLNQSFVENESQCDVVKNYLSIDSFDFNNVELTLLDTIRFICAVTSGLENASWKIVHHNIEGLGAPFPPDFLVGSAFNLVQAIMKDRSRQFGFMSSQCKNCGPKITKDELDIVWLLRAACGGNGAEINRAAQSVSGSNEISNIRVAAIHIGVLMQAIPDQPEQSDKLHQLPIGKTIH